MAVIFYFTSTKFMDAHGSWPLLMLGAGENYFMDSDHVPGLANEIFNDFSSTKMPRG